MWLIPSSRGHSAGSLSTHHERVCWRVFPHSSSVHVVGDASLFAQTFLTSDHFLNYLKDHSVPRWLQLVPIWGHLSHFLFGSVFFTTTDNAAMNTFVHRAVRLCLILLLR